MNCTNQTPKIWDILVIGAGACGLSAAINGASEGLQVLLIDRLNMTGGLIGTTSKIENYPGFPDGIEGRDLTNRMTEQALKFGAEIMLSTVVHSIQKEEETNLFKASVETLYDVVEDRTMLPIYAKSVIMASGRIHKKLNLNNEIDLVTNGKLVYGHPPTHIPIKGHICIIGGGNSAGQAATWLTKQACAVTLVAPHLDNMSDYLVQRIQSPNSFIKVIYGKVVAINHMTQDLLIYVNTIEEGNQTISAAKVYSLVGLQVDDTFRDMKDDSGFLYTETLGMVVAGDCREESEKRCTAAVGEGVVALAKIYRYLNNMKQDSVNKELQDSHILEQNVSQ